MTEANHWLGRISLLKAEALGQPGARRFRLVVESRRGGSALIWMEKQQLFDLAVAIKRVIAVVDRRGGRRASPQPLAEEQGDVIGSGDSPVELQVGRMALSYDEDHDLFLLAGYDVESERDDPAVVSLTATEEEVDALADEAFEVCAAGRPRCVLCGAPMGPEPHVCPRHNGHRMPAS